MIVNDAIKTKISFLKNIQPKTETKLSVEEILISCMVINGKQIILTNTTSVPKCIHILLYKSQIT